MCRLWKHNAHVLLRPNLDNHPVKQLNVLRALKHEKSMQKHTILSLKVTSVCQACYATDRTMTFRQTTCSNLKSKFAQHMCDMSHSFSSTCLEPMSSSPYAFVQHQTHQCCIAAMNIMHHKLCAQPCSLLKPVGCQLWTHSGVLIHGKHSTTGAVLQESPAEMHVWR